MDYAPTATLTAMAPPTWTISESRVEESFFSSQYSPTSAPSPDGFVMVAIDGNSHLFLEQLVTRGQQGGAWAAEKLVEKVNHDYPTISNVAISIFVDVEELSLCHRNAGIILHPSGIHHFIWGFEEFSHLIRVFDISGQTITRATRLKDLYALYLGTPNCRHVLLGCSRQDVCYILGQSMLDNVDVACTSFLATLDSMLGGALNIYRKVRIDIVF